MKRILYIAIFTALCGQLRAQQTTQFTQYIFNQFSLHPALAGWRDCFEVRIGYRTQWLNFPGAPKTAFANFHTSLTRKKKGYLKSKHGIGANVESDQMGPFGITRLYLAYAYHIPMNRKLKLSMGLYAGIQQYKLDVSKLTLNDYRDPAITGRTSTFVYPDVWPSLFLYSNDFFAGVTVRQMLGNRIKNITDDSRLRHHYILSMGKRVPFGRSKKVDLIPSASLKIANLSAPALDLNVLADFSNRFQLGLSWRNTDALCGMARINIRNISVGYSFDFTTSKIKYGSANTHEIILGINTCKPDKRNSDECPIFN